MRTTRHVSGAPVSEVWLVVGLGNPGPAYAGHRHNVGYLVVDVLADGWARPSALTSPAGPRWSRAGSAPPAADVPRVVLARPRSYMNESGGAVSTLAEFYKVPAERIVAVHDELDIPFGALRIKLGGGDNGHNGLRSMRSSLGTGDFYRVRVGIGRPPGRQDLADFVLSNYSSPSARSCRCWSSRPPTRWRAWSPTVSRRRSSSSTAEGRSASG